MVYWISSKCWENFYGFASSVLKVLPLLKPIIGKIFVDHGKSAKTTKLFSLVAFMVYSYSNVQTIHFKLLAIAQYYFRGSINFCIGLNNVAMLKLECTIIDVQYDSPTYICNECMYVHVILFL